MLRRDAVIAGCGCVSPYGAGVECFWSSLLEGRQAFRPITRFDASPYRNALAGEVPALPEAPAGPHAAGFLRQAVLEACSAAALGEETCAPERIGVVLGTNFGCAQAGLDALRHWHSNPTELPDLAASAMGSGLDVVRDVLPFRGPGAVLSLACASGAAAIGQALTWVRSGHVEVALAGGFDELSEHAYAGLSGLRAITKDTIRPFDARRSGTLFAEGAGIVVVEAREHATARGVRPAARLLGHGINNDAFHMTTPDKSGAGIAAVLRMALADSGLKAERIGHINCHGTGTKYNDLIETQAIKAVFGAHAAGLVLTANKSAIGHTMGAAGALEAISTILTLREGRVPPTVGLEQPDPELDLDYCPGTARNCAVEAAMTNSYGFGGTNASLVLARCD